MIIRNLCRPVELFENEGLTNALEGMQRVVLVL